MRFRFNGNVMTSPAGFIQPQVVEWFRNVFGMGATWIHPDSGQMWQLVDDGIIVLTNPDSTFTTQTAKAEVIRNAYHISAAFPQAVVYCPFTNAVGQQIVNLEEPAALRVHFQLRYIGE